MSQHISIIAAIANNRVIGINNTLPWHLPEDLKRFRALTMGHHIVMGRKTFESLGRLLPGRDTVIVSRNQNYSVPGALVATSLEAALAACGNDNEVFVIGGAQLYREALSRADRLYVTEIAADFDGDAHFPEVDASVWKQVSREPHVSSSGLHFYYVFYQRC
jgi:dihydrofolate reductase